MHSKTKYIILILILIGSVQILFEKTSAIKLDLEKGKIAYKKYGNGPKTIIAIHGSPGSKNDFRLVAPLIENATVYTLDMYGFGDSSSVVSNYGAKEASKTVIEFMEAKNIEKVDFLGYSWGGAVGIDLAYSYPDKVNNLFLLGSMGIQEGEPTGMYWSEQTRYYIAYPFVVFYPGTFFGSFGIRNGFMRSFMDTDQRVYTKKLQELKTPVIIVHGKSDTVVPNWVAKKHNELIPNSKLLYYTGGHGRVFSDGTEIAKIISGEI